MFALASANLKAGVLFPTPPQREHHHTNEFTSSSFDIWCAGLSADTFGLIGDDLAPYKEMLDRSLRPQDTFKLKEIAGLDKETRAARGIQRRRMAAPTTDHPGHDAIHVSDEDENNGRARAAAAAPARRLIWWMGASVVLLIR